jgi:YjbE family integral membrane protein
MGHQIAVFLFNVFSIVLIDVLLAGDNAVVIALAVKSLPVRERRIGITAGASAAVILRIVLTFFAARLLQLNYVRFVGGALVIWIAVKLFSDAHADEETVTRARGLWQAVWFILVADVTMSIDNILAVAAASKGSLPLLIFGLGLSIPFVVFTSNLLAQCMDRWPIVIYAGAAILGRVGADMMIGDPWIIGLLHPSRTLEIAVQVFFAAAVLVAGMAVHRHLRRPTETRP